ncbi:hypothetical protein NOVOSPHI9U_740004 [Novosphingobium sp. 9U]|nr:hypothetical protein NOVOSPHI9U_740004 [Novosphingobium sp. 9U]
MVEAAALYEQDPCPLRRSGTPLGFVLTSGEVSDYRAVPALLDMPVTMPKALLADKGYDSDGVAKTCSGEASCRSFHPR